MDPAPGKEGGILVIAPDVNPVLQVQALSMTYGADLVLDNVTLSVPKGEILGLVGPNGAGKTTLIKVLSGVLQPLSGEVFVNQQEITELTPAQRARALAVVPQAHQLGGAFSVEQAVLLGRTAYLGFLGRPNDADQEKVRWAMEQTDVLPLAERKLAEISGGEQQRVLLARALAQDTPVMLLDEPTSHLDLRYQVELLQLLKSLVTQQELTVLMAMHDLNQVSGTADRVALMVDGRLQAIGSPGAVLTPENIQAAYHTKVESFIHPQTDKYFILPKS
jgi:iron complex transport system ATP-binding protein